MALMVVWMVILGVWLMMLISVVVRVMADIGVVCILVHSIPFSMMHLVMEIFRSVIVIPDRLNQHIT